MPTLPDKSALGLRPITASFRPTSVPANPIGPALQGLGQAISGIADEGMRENMRSASSSMQTSVIQHNAAAAQLVDEVKRNAPVGAAGVDAEFAKQYDERAQQLFINAPAELKDWTRQQLVSTRERLLDDVRTFQTREGDRAEGVRINEGLTVLLNEIDKDPTRVNEVMSQGRDLILTSKRTEQDKQAALSEWERGAILTEATRRAGPYGADAADAALSGGALAGQHKTVVDTGDADVSALGPSARTMLQGIADAGVVPNLKVVSGFRDAARNRQAGGAKASQHIHGNAVDISLAGLSDEEKAAVLTAAVASGAKGIGIYPGGSLHIDTRSTPAVWGSVKGAAHKGHDISKAPAWAQPVLRQMFSGKPVTVTPRAGSAVDVFVERVVGAENSTGDPTARNPNSTATGDGQFIESTWLEMMRKYRPEDAGRLSEAQQLELRKDPAVSREMVRAYADENGKRLQKYGIPATAGTLYLAHFLGPDTAAAVIQAPPDAPVADLVGARAVAANRSVLKGKTAGDVVAWAGEKVGRAGRPDAAAIAAEFIKDPRFDRLTVDQRREIERSVIVGFNGQIKSYEAAAAEAKRVAGEERVAYKGAWDLGIETGERLDRDELLADPYLTDAEKAEFLPRLEKKAEQVGAIRNLEQAFVANQTPSLNPYDTEDKKVLNEFYQSLGGADGLVEGDPAAAQRFVEVADWSGVVPQAGAAAIRAAMDSPILPVVENALRVAQRLTERRPSAFTALDGGSAIADAAATYDHLVNELGMSGTEAAKRFMSSRDPESVRRKDANKEGADLYVKGIEPSAALKAIDPAADAAGFTPAMANQMMADFKRFARERFERHGDPDIATAEAVGDMRRTYGVTDVTGTPTLMRFPPERFYPPVDGGFDYMREQMVAAVNEHAGIDTTRPATLDERLRTPDESVRPEDIVLVPTDRTVAAVRAGRLPPYAVMYYREENGQRVLHEVTGLHFVADPAGPRSATTAERGQQFRERQEDRTILNDMNRDATGVPSRDEMFPPAPPPASVAPTVDAPPADKPAQTLEDRLKALY